MHHKNKVKPTKSMKSAKIILIAFCLTLMMSFKHPYYVGVIDINWLSKKKFEVSIKLFTDDLQAAIYNKFKMPFSSLEKSEKNKNYLIQYINRHFSIFQKSVKKSTIIPLDFVGWEVEDEATWIYYQCSTPQKINSENGIMVRSQLLHNVVDKQVTIVHLNKNGKRTSEQFIQPATAIEFN